MNRVRYLAALAVLCVLCAAAAPAHAWGPLARRLLADEVIEALPKELRREFVGLEDGVRFHAGLPAYELSRPEARIGDFCFVERLDYEYRQIFERQWARARKWVRTATDFHGFLVEYDRVFFLRRPIPIGEKAAENALRALPSDREDLDRLLGWYGPELVGTLLYRPGEALERLERAAAEGRRDEIARAAGEIVAWSALINQPLRLTLYFRGGPDKNFAGFDGDERDTISRIEDGLVQRYQTELIESIDLRRIAVQRRSGANLHREILRIATDTYRRVDDLLEADAAALQQAKIADPRGKPDETGEDQWNAYYRTAHTALLPQAQRLLGEAGALARDLIVEGMQPKR